MPHFGFTEQLPEEAGCYWVQIPEYGEVADADDMFPVFFDGENVHYFAQIGQQKVRGGKLELKPLDTVTMSDVLVPARFTALHWGPRIQWPDVGWRPHVGQQSAPVNRPCSTAPPWG
jgi:hypothetical protein